MPASDSPQDLDRLRALDRTGLLTEPAPEEFQAICQRARERFEVPIALVTLVAADKILVKAGLGASPPETPRLHQFCERTIRGNDVLVVPDAATEPLFAENPLVRGPPFARFYAGAPLRYVRNIQLGALCLLDTRPRDFPEKDRADLERLAEEVSALIVSRAFERIAGSIAH